ncbi:pentapeptide repeat-containing protein [Lysobacter sp. HA35]
MFREQALVTEAAELSKLLNDSVLRYCELAVPSVDGGHVDSTFLFCTLRGIDWYWPLFNLAVFVSCTFTGCSFRGAVFAGCRFVDCRFEECTFGGDNLNGDCEFGESVWYGCTQKNCIGLGGFVPAEA